MVINIENLMINFKSDKIIEAITSLILDVDYSEIPIIFAKIALHKTDFKPTIIKKFNELIKKLLMKKKHEQ